MLVLGSLISILTATVAILINGIIITNMVIDTTYRMIPSIKKNNKITLIFLLLFYITCFAEIVAFIFICIN